VVASRFDRFLKATIICESDIEDRSGISFRYESGDDEVTKPCEVAKPNAGLAFPNARAALAELLNWRLLMMYLVLRL
jgi:hypothetical protein